MSSSFRFRFVSSLCTSPSLNLRTDRLLYTTESNERIRRTRFDVFIFALEVEVRAVRAQKKVHRQIEKQSEPPFVIIRDLRINRDSPPGCIPGSRSGCR